MKRWYNDLLLRCLIFQRNFKVKSVNENIKEFRKSKKVYSYKLRYAMSLDKRMRAKWKKITTFEKSLAMPLLKESQGGHCKNHLSIFINVYKFSIKFVKRGNGAFRVRLLDKDFPKIRWKNLYVICSIFKFEEYPQNPNIRCLRNWNLLLIIVRSVLKIFVTNFLLTLKIYKNKGHRST